MATRKQLVFSSSGDDCDVSVSDIEKHDPMHVAAEEEEESKKKEKKNNKKKKMKMKRKLIWSEEDELKILKGLIDYGAKNPDNFDWDRFFSFAQRSIVPNVSEEEMASKIRKLKRKFLVHEKRLRQGNDPLFTRCSDSELFGYGSMLWSQNNAEKEGEETVKEDDQAGNADEPVNENGAEETIEGRTVGEESRDNDKLNKEGHEETLNEQAGNAGEPVNENAAENKESLHEQSRDGGNDEDEFCSVRDAFETLVFKGASGHEKKLQVEMMVMKIPGGKRKQLSHEWKELCSEVARFNLKKFKYTTKLAEAAIDG